MITYFVLIHRLHRKFSAFNYIHIIVNKYEIMLMWDLPLWSKNDHFADQMYPQRILREIVI